MEVDVLSNLRSFMQGGGEPIQAIRMLSDGYRGHAEVARMLSHWLSLAGDQSGDQVIFTHVSGMVVDHFDPEPFSSVMAKESKTPDWLSSLIEESAWHPALRHLRDKYPECTMLAFALRVITQVQGSSDGAANRDPSLADAMVDGRSSVASGGTDDKMASLGAGFGAGFDPSKNFQHFLQQTVQLTVALWRNPDRASILLPEFTRMACATEYGYLIVLRCLRTLVLEGNDRQRREEEGTGTETGKDGGAEAEQTGTVAAPQSGGGGKDSLRARTSFLRRMWQEVAQHAHALNVGVPERTELLVQGAGSRPRLQRSLTAMLGEDDVLPHEAEFLYGFYREAGGDDTESERETKRRKVADKGPPVEPSGTSSETSTEPQLAYPISLLRQPAMFRLLIRVLWGREAKTLSDTTRSHYLYLLATAACAGADASVTPASIVPAIDATTPTPPLPTPTNNTANTTNTTTAPPLASAVPLTTTPVSSCTVTTTTLEALSTFQRMCMRSFGPKPSVALKAVRPLCQIPVVAAAALFWVRRVLLNPSYLDEPGSSTLTPCLLALMAHVTSVHQRHRATVFAAVRDGLALRARVDPLTLNQFRRQLLSLLVHLTHCGHVRPVLTLAAERIVLLDHALIRSFIIQLFRSIGPPLSPSFVQLLLTLLNHPSAVTALSSITAAPPVSKLKPRQGPHKPRQDQHKDPKNDPATRKAAARKADPPAKEEKETAFASLRRIAVYLLSDHPALVQLPELANAFGLLQRFAGKKIRKLRPV